MQDRKVIYDSEDEDEGFSPLSSPARGDASHVVMTAEEDDAGKCTGNQVGDSRSTDPEFFKRIYEEQQKTIAKPVPESVRDTQAQTGSSDKLKSSDSKAKNNSSSITDPALKSSRKRGLGKLDAKDFGNLTQVTTPSAPSAKKDVYDFTLSDEEGAPVGPAMLQTTSKGARTASKRKRGQSVDPLDAPVTANSSPPHVSTSHLCTEDQEDESPRSTRKKRKSSREQRPRPVPDDVDLLVLPPSANMSEPPHETNMDQDGWESTVPDTRVTQGPSSPGNPPATSFFIAPPDNLTLSQKQEYLRVSDNSELDIEDDQQQALLPATKPAQTQGQRSTDTSVSTIAYTTPSRYASSIAPLPILESCDGRSSNVATSSEKRTRFEKTNPHSSPDELSAHSIARKNRSKRHMSAVDEEDELAQQDSWDSNKVGYSRENSVPRHSRNSGAGRESIKDTEAEADTSNTGKKKRQKRGGNAETSNEDSWDSDKVGFHREHYAPRPSRRRSRLIMEEDENIQHPEESMPDTCPPGNASYTKTADAGSTAIASGWQAPDEVNGGIAGVDPEVWAALPDDIRQELISQQQSARNLQASRTRRSGRAGEATSGLVHVREETPQPKKRGRKKKIQMVEQVPVTFDAQVAALEEPETRPSPPPAATAKRKRGRPRKAEAAPPQPFPEIQESALAMDVPEMFFEADEEPSATHSLPEELWQDVEAPKTSANRGRKKKMIGAPPVQLNELNETPYTEGEGGDTVGSMGKQAVEPSHSSVDAPAVSVETEDRPALRDISSRASNWVVKSDSSASDQTAEGPATDEAEKQLEVTPEPKAKRVPKSASTPGQQGKVPLRVGLSKRSRIAPLLKNIRK